MLFRRRTDVGSLIARDDVAGLIRALGVTKRDFARGDAGELIDLGETRRSQAARALADHDAAEVSPALTSALSDPTPSVRSAAARSLSERDDPMAEPVVGTLLEWEPGPAATQVERWLAARAQRDDDSAVEYAWAYLRAGAAPSRQLSDRWVRDVVRACPGPAREQLAQAALSQQLEGEQPSHRSLQILAQDAAHSGPLLVSRLEESDGRALTVRLLGATRSAAGVEALVGLLSDEDADTRREAADALGRIRHPAAVDALLVASADDDYDVRDAAMGALDALGTAGTVWGLASSARGAIGDALRSGTLAPGEAPASAALAESTPGSAVEEADGEHAEPGRS